MTSVQEIQDAYVAERAAYRAYLEKAKQDWRQSTEFQRLVSLVRSAVGNGVRKAQIVASTGLNQGTLATALATDIVANPVPTFPVDTEAHLDRVSVIRVSPTECRVTLDHWPYEEGLYTMANVRMTWDELLESWVPEPSQNGWAVERLLFAGGENELQKAWKEALNESTG